MVLAIFMDESGFDALSEARLSEKDNLFRCLDLLNFRYCEHWIRVVEKFPSFDDSASDSLVGLDLN